MTRNVDLDRFNGSLGDLLGFVVLPQLKALFDSSKGYLG